MHSFSTTYHCAACEKTFPVEVTDLDDPYAHIPEHSRESMRRVRETQNKFGQNNPGDPVEELAGRLLEQDARGVLLRATCPGCKARNPAGVADDRKEHISAVLFGCIFFGILAIVAWYYSWAALILPGVSLFVLRPIMFFQLRKVQDKPFPVLRFITGILFDIGYIAAVLNFPIIAPGIPLIGVVQSLLGGMSKYEWKWEEAQKKLRFAPLENVAA